MSKSPKTAKASYSVLQQKKDLIFVLCMLAVPVVNFLLFWLWPNFRSITMAFEIPSVEGFTFYNFERFFNELASPITGPGLWKEIGNSFLMFFVGTFVNLPMVLFMSYVMFKKVAGYKVFRVLFYLPSIIGGTVMSQIYRAIVAADGPVQMLLDMTGVTFGGGDLLGSSESGMVMMIIYMLWTGVGSNMIMFTGAMNRVPQDIFESARIDGIGFFGEFFNIILPLIWPTVTTMVVFSMVGVFSNAGIVMLLCPDNKDCSNIGWYILRFTLGSTTTANERDALGYPAAVGFIFTLVNLPLVYGTKWLFDRIGKNVEY